MSSATVSPNRIKEIRQGRIKSLQKRLADLKKNYPNRYGKIREIQTELNKVRSQVHGRTPTLPKDYKKTEAAARNVAKAHDRPKYLPDEKLKKGFPRKVKWKSDKTQNVGENNKKVGNNNNNNTAVNSEKGITSQTAPPPKTYADYLKKNFPERTPVKDTRPVRGGGTVDSRTGGLGKYTNRSIEVGPLKIGLGDTSPVIDIPWNEGLQPGGLNSIRTMGELNQLQGSSAFWQRGGGAMQIAKRRMELANELEAQQAAQQAAAQQAEQVNALRNKQYDVQSPEYQKTFSDYLPPANQGLSINTATPTATANAIPNQSLMIQQGTPFKNLPAMQPLPPIIPPPVVPANIGAQLGSSLGMLPSGGIGVVGAIGGA